jgi:hypothetical protein
MRACLSHGRRAAIDDSLRLDGESYGTIARLGLVYSPGGDALTIVDRPLQAVRVVAERARYAQ